MLNILNQLTVNHFIALSMALFIIGMVGVLVRKNVIVILMSIELMLNAVNLSFVAFARYFGDANGQVIVFFVMAIAAAEAAIGLAIAVSVFRKFNGVEIKLFENLKG
jgi:NADH-quinone oxidoreductase subunit K